MKIMGNKKGACMFPKFFWSGGSGAGNLHFLKHLEGDCGGGICVLIGLRKKLVGKY